MDLRERIAHSLRREREDKRRVFFERHPELNGKWSLGPSRATELERTALSLPLSRERRPGWDARILAGLGLQVVSIVEQVGRGVQDPVEFERDAPTQMFMVCAEKEVI